MLSKSLFDIFNLFYTIIIILLSLLVSLSLLKEKINISPGVDGSANTYTITYFESSAGITCGSDTVESSNCNETCIHFTKLSSLLCNISKNITVSVFATNRIGDGPIKEGIMISSYNQNNNNECKSISFCFFFFQFLQCIQFTR